MIKASTVFSLLLIGFIFGYSIHFFLQKDIEIETKINIINLVGLAVTLFLAFYIPLVIQTSLTNKRYERDVLIRRVEKISGYFKEVDNLFYKSFKSKSVSTEDASLIILNFTYISNELKALMDLSVRVCPKKLSKKLEVIKVLRGQYKKIITGGKFRSAGFSYSIPDKIKVEKAIFVIDTELSHLIFDINAF